MANVSVLLGLLLVLPLLAQASTTSTTYGMYSTNGHYYAVVTSSTPIQTWGAATQLANQMILNGNQGYLATINDAGESNYVLNYIASQLTGSTATVGWIGGQRSGNTWFWQALTRTSATFYVQGSGCQTQNNQYCNWNAAPPSAATATQWYLPGTANSGQWIGVDGSNAPTTVFIIEWDPSTSTSCNTGFAYSGGSCKDINECAASTNPCGSGYTCANTIGSYTCTDINECAASTSPCASGQTCTNTPGSYTCTTPTTAPTGATFYIQSSLNGLVVDLQSTTAGANLVMNVPSMAATQQWTYTSSNQFVNPSTGFAMDIKGADSSLDTRVIGWPVKSPVAANQQWTYSSSTQMITSALSTSDQPRVLDVYAVSTAQGAQLCIWTPKSTGNQNQLWNLTAIANPTVAPTTTAAPITTTTTTTTTTVAAPMP